MASFSTGLFKYMSRYYSYLNSAKTILSGYTGDQPFASFIRTYFSANKKFGSKDRKTIAGICYVFFRTKYLLQNENFEDHIKKAVFLCQQEGSFFLELLSPKLNDKTDLSTQEKLDLFELNPLMIFPFYQYLSRDISVNDFCLSFLIQPDLYLRIRPGKQPAVIEKLEQAAVPFRQITPLCIALPNGVSAEKILQVNKDVIIQDLNSQKVFAAVAGLKKIPGKKLWDCCAASGGKSLLWHDTINQNVDLIVSDIRKIILQNLRQRFAEAGIQHYHTLVADLEKENAVVNKFDVIVCDAPCTGSGTWSRTPEQLAFFKEEAIAIYSQKQKTIAGNAIKSLADDGYFIYITCSVFAMENEDVVIYLNKQSHMKTIHQEYLEGYNQQADSLFVAILQKNLL